LITKSLNLVVFIGGSETLPDYFG